MSKRLAAVLIFTLVALFSGLAMAAGDPRDAAGASDPPVFTRMPGFHIYNATVKDFDRHEFAVSADKKEVVEGKLYNVIYYANDGITLPSALQIARNYANAAASVGGQKLHQYEDGGREFLTLKVLRDGAEYWAEVQGSGNGMYSLVMVEKKAMAQEVAVTAEVMATGIRETGKAAIYGIYFDTGKSLVKPQSEPALAEMVKLVKADPKTKLYVVGHTDNQGSLESNMKLSRDRAEAVVKALTAKGVTAALLQPHGVGPLAPVASNASEDGRAKNRRVELVAQ